MNTTTFYEVITANKNHMETEVYDLLLGMVREELAKEAEKSAGRKGMHDPDQPRSRPSSHLSVRNHGYGK